MLQGSEDDALDHKGEKEVVEVGGVLIHFESPLTRLLWEIVKQCERSCTQFLEYNRYSKLAHCS